MRVEDSGTKGVNSHEFSMAGPYDPAMLVFILAVDVIS